MIYWNTKKQNGSFRRLPFTKIATIAWNNNWRVFVSSDLSTLYLAHAYQNDYDVCLYGYDYFNDDFEDGLLLAMQDGTRRECCAALAYCLRKRFDKLANGEKL